MKYLLYILLLCCSWGYGQGADYVIAQKTLEHFAEYEKFRLIAQPNNEYIQKVCVNGFYSGEVYGEETLDLRNLKFTYSNIPVQQWKPESQLWGKIANKIEIVDDFEKIAKVSLLDYKKANTYIALSNPAFSEDGNYAIIFFEHFTNMNGTEAEGFFLIFKKVNNEWSFFRQFTVYLT